MEESIRQFEQWVAAQTDEFYRLILAQDNPGKFFTRNTFRYFAMLATEMNKLVDQYRAHLTWTEADNLTVRLQDICEASLGEIDKRLKMAPTKRTPEER
jgi:hypothetical protein